MPPSASHCSDVGWADRLFGPGFFTRDHGVYEDQELPGAGDERRLVRLSFGNQALIQRDELSVPTERGRQGRAIQSAPYALTAAFDMARTDLATAVIVVGGKSSKRGNLFARDAADLRHAHQDGDRRRQPDAVHALDQVQPLGQIGMLADCFYQRLELSLLEPFETGDLILPETSDTRVPAARAAGLDEGDVLCDLIDQRQVLGIGRQARIGGAWIFRVAAAQVAIRAASILSFFASCRWNIA